MSSKKKKLIIINCIGILVIVGLGFLLHSLLIPNVTQQAPGYQNRPVETINSRKENM